VGSIQCLLQLELGAPGIGGTRFPGVKHSGVKWTNHISLMPKLIMEIHFQDYNVILCW
jgi:ABC-type transport system involved in cytochrome c biogenesis permease subunit